MKNLEFEGRTRKHRIIVSKLIYLRAYKFAKRHKVFWSRIQVTEMGDSIDGTVLIEFRAKRAMDELIKKDMEYIVRIDERTKAFYEAGREQLYSK